MALGVTPLRVGQEAYWLEQIARDACEYYAGKGESPGWWAGSLADRAGLQGEASEEAVHRLFAGQDPLTGEQRVAPVWRSDPRSRLSADPLQAATPRPPLGALSSRQGQRGDGGAGLPHGPRTEPRGAVRAGVRGSAEARRQAGGRAGGIL